LLVTPLAREPSIRGSFFGCIRCGHAVEE
jgi:hypothetical protein